MMTSGGSSPPRHLMQVYDDMNKAKKNDTKVKVSKRRGRPPVEWQIEGEIVSMAENGENKNNPNHEVSSVDRAERLADLVGEIILKKSSKR